MISFLHSKGKEMVDYIADYLQNIRQRRVFPDVKPGYIRTLLPDKAPDLGEDWDTIFSDVERVIMPGVSCPYLVCQMVRKKLHSHREQNEFL